MDIEQQRCTVNSKCDLLTGESVIHAELQSARSLQDDTCSGAVESDRHPDRQAEGQPTSAVGLETSCVDTDSKLDNSESAHKPKLWADYSAQELWSLSRLLSPDLNLYAVMREPRRVPNMGMLSKELLLSKSGLAADLTCPICTSVYRRVMVVKNCLHRFCADCIERWLRSGYY
eukprot:Lankesteria_metandrocarpae@DN2871_c0_g1_i1.p1